MFSSPNGKKAYCYKPFLSFGSMPCEELFWVLNKIDLSFQLNKDKGEMFFTQSGDLYIFARGCTHTHNTLKFP